MKCPYRLITTTTDNSTTIEFAECYGKECPMSVNVIEDKVNILCEVKQ